MGETALDLARYLGNVEGFEGTVDDLNFGDPQESGGEKAVLLSNV